MHTTWSPEKSALLALLGRRGIKPHDVVTDILEQDDPAVSIDLLERHLKVSEGLFPESDLGDLLAHTQRQIEQWEAQGIGVHACFEDTYPHQLRDIREMPAIVFTRGTPARDDRAVAVVGTRSASDEALRRTHRIAAMLAEQSITVVSGLALGIDARAHRTALDAGARTVAVTANGVDECYPDSNWTLQNEIAEKGLVLSEYLPGTRPAKWRFLERNAIMSGYAAATIVVEAGERSGTRTQVQRALEHGRPVILLEDVLDLTWAHEAAQRPGVRVAASLSELRKLVDDVLAGPSSRAQPFATFA